MLDTLRDSAPSTADLTYAMEPEKGHAATARQLLTEAPHHPGNLISKAQVEATLAQAAATGRLADAMERVAAATRIAR